MSEKKKNVRSFNARKQDVCEVLKCQKKCKWGHRMSYNVNKNIVKEWQKKDEHKKVKGECQKQKYVCEVIDCEKKLMYT